MPELSSGISYWDYSQELGGGVDNAALEGQENLMGQDHITGSNFSDTLEGFDGNDTIFGGEGDDNIYGGDGDDVIVGTKGTNLLDGGAGNDLIIGKPGKDVIVGGEGNDTIFGGKGKDTVTGGAGADIFVLNAVGKKNMSIITDFNSAEGDRLQLVANKRFRGLMNANGSLREGVFTTVSNRQEALADTNHRLIYNAGSGKLFFRESSGALVEVAKLTNKPDLKASDIFVAQKPTA